jgi:hypothetical protein
MILFNNILPIDTEIEIYSFLRFEDMIKIINNKEYFHMILSHKFINMNKTICYGIYYNLNNNCYYCNTVLDTDFILNLCFNCTFYVDYYNSYPMICKDCVTPVKRGKTINAKCKGCDIITQHLGISGMS